MKKKVSPKKRVSKAKKTSSRKRKPHTAPDSESDQSNNADEDWEPSQTKTKKQAKSQMVGNIPKPQTSTFLLGLRTPLTLGWLVWSPILSQT